MMYYSSFFLLYSRKAENIPLLESSDNLSFYMTGKYIFAKGMAHDEAVATQKIGKAVSPPKVLYLI
jgi:hypothetical protein